MEICSLLPLYSHMWSSSSDSTRNHPRLPATDGAGIILPVRGTNVPSRSLMKCDTLLVRKATSSLQVLQDERYVVTVGSRRNQSFASFLGTNNHPARPRTIRCSALSNEQPSALETLLRRQTLRSVAFWAHSQCRIKSATR